MSRIGQTVVLAAIALAACKTPQSGAPGSLTLDLSSERDAWFEPLKPARWREVVAREWRRTNIKVGGDVFGIDVADLAQLSGHARASVRMEEPGVYLRTDEWRIGYDVGPGSLLLAAAGQELPVSIGLKGGRDVTFIRPFSDQNTALRALPRLPTDIPLDSKRALAMRSGDFVSLPVQMGLTLGVARGQSLPHLALQASAGVFWLGEFRVNVSRLDGSFVRLKIVPSDVRGTFLAADAFARLDYFGYGPFGLVDLDRQAERGLGLDVLRLADRRVKDGETMAVDYVIDVGDEHGARAYDAILADTMRLKADVLAAQSVRGLADAAFGDITLAEALHAYDAAEPPHRRRVARVFRGQRFFDQDTFSVRLGTKLWRASDQKHFSANAMRTFDERSRPFDLEYFVFSTQRRTSAIVSAARRNYASAATAVVAPHGGTDALAGMRFEWSSQERLASTGDKASIAWSLYAVLGDHYRALGLGSVMPSVAPDKLAVRLDLGLSSGFFAALSRMADEDPEQLEKWLWSAVSVMTPRFERRQGPRTPAPAQSISGEARRLMQSSLLSLRNATRNLLNRQWEGINGTTVTRLVDGLLGVRQAGGSGMARDVLQLMYDDESAQEIAPAMLLTLSSLWNIEPWISAKVMNGSTTVFEQSIGRSENDELLAGAATAYQRLSQSGYER